MTDFQPSLPGDVQLSFAEVFSGGTDETFFRTTGWPHPVAYFVGRNGSGKSRAARLVAQQLGGRYLATDRLTGIMNFTNYGWTSFPEMQSYKGIPLSDQERGMAQNFSASEGSAVGEMYALKDQPEVWLRVAAFLRRALGRIVELRESAGFLDPFVALRTSGGGHGVRPPAARSMRRR